MEGSGLCSGHYRCEAGGVFECRFCEQHQRFSMMAALGMIINGSTVLPCAQLHVAHSASWFSDVGACPPCTACIKAAPIVFSNCNLYHRLSRSKRNEVTGSTILCA